MLWMAVRVGEKCSMTGRISWQHEAGFIMKNTRDAVLSSRLLAKEHFFFHCGRLSCIKPDVLGILLGAQTCLGQKKKSCVLVRRRRY